MFFDARARARRAARARRRARARRSRRCCPARVTLLLPNPARPLPARRAGRTRRRSACACPRCRRGSPRSTPCAGRCCSRARTAPAAPTRARSTRSPSRSARAADLVLDGGELPGTPSTVVDLRALRDARATGRSCARARSPRDEVRDALADALTCCRTRPRSGAPLVPRSIVRRVAPALEVTELEPQAAAPSASTLDRRARPRRRRTRSTAGMLAVEARQPDADRRRPARPDDARLGRPRRGSSRAPAARPPRRLAARARRAAAGSSSGSSRRTRLDEHARDRRATRT